MYEVLINYMTKIANISVGGRNPVRIMGILNTSPESFYKKSINTTRTKIKNAVIQMENDGADFIDVGGMSTAPYLSTIVSEKIESKRVLDAIKIIQNHTNLPISVDTCRSSVAEKALKNDVEIINDISGLKYDKKTISVLKRYKTPFVIHHIQGTPTTMQVHPKYKNVLFDIYDFFEERIKHVRINGIKHNNIIVDPGIGFGKNLKHNMKLISNISIFHSLGFPILLGISRKKFIKDISGINDSKNRFGGTISASLYATLQGVQILRIHDVNEVIQSIKVFKKLIKN